jgi:hypothetical protein
MEFSLLLSFYLTHSLRGDMVATIAGLSTETVEALAPQSHHQILQKCSQ